MMKRSRGIPGRERQTTSGKLDVMSSVPMVISECLLRAMNDVLMITNPEALIRTSKYSFCTLYDHGSIYSMAAESRSS